MNIYDQLQAVEDRYEELGELLSDPEVVSDTKRFMELSREEANTRETVTAYREYKQVIQSISDAEEMIKEASGDPDLEEMAKEELKESKAAKEEYEERAIITKPEILLADEPTGALDSKSSAALLDVFDAINDSGQTILMVTHSTAAASRAQRVLFIKDGILYNQIFKGDKSEHQMFQEISDTLTVMASEVN